MTASTRARAKTGASFVVSNARVRFVSVPYLIGLIELIELELSSKKRESSENLAATARASASPHSRASRKRIARANGFLRFFSFDGFVTTWSPSPPIPVGLDGNGFDALKTLRENFATSPAAKTRASFVRKAPSTTTPPSVTNPNESSAAKSLWSTSLSSHPKSAVASTAVTAPVRVSEKYARTPGAPLRSTHASQPASASPRIAGGWPGRDNASKPKPFVLEAAHSANDANRSETLLDSKRALLAMSRSPSWARVFLSTPSTSSASSSSTSSCVMSNASGTTLNTLPGSNPSRASVLDAPSASSVAPYTKTHSQVSTSSFRSSLGMPLTCCTKSSRRSTGVSRTSGSSSQPSPSTARLVSSRDAKQSKSASKRCSPPSAKRA